MGPEPEQKRNVTGARSLADTGSNMSLPTPEPEQKRNLTGARSLVDTGSNMSLPTPELGQKANLSAALVDSGSNKSQAGSAKTVLVPQRPNLTKAPVASGPPEESQPQPA